MSIVNFKIFANVAINSCETHEKIPLKSGADNRTLILYFEYQ